MLMVDCDGKIWMDGKLIDWCDVKIYVLIYMLYYGMGVFEGVCVYKVVDGSIVIFCLFEYIKCLLNLVKIF